MHSSDAISVLKYALHNPCCFTQGSNFIFEHRLFKTQAANPIMFVFQVAFFGLKPSAIDDTCLVYGRQLAGNICACPERWSYGQLTLVPMSYLKLRNFIFCPSRRHREAPGDNWRQLEATEAKSRAQILARQHKSNPLPKPPGPLKLSLFVEQTRIEQIHERTSKMFRLWDLRRFSLRRRWSLLVFLWSKHCGL